MEKHFRITVDGKEYMVTVEDLGEEPGRLYPQAESMNLHAPHASPAAPASAPAVASPARAPAAAGDVVCTIGGVVDAILVSVGQQVATGDKVATVEAMKMKTPMIAHRSGRVAAIAVKAGDPVEAGQTLVRLD